jgi:hypothetical protein
MGQKRWSFDVNADCLAAWFQRQGYRVFQTASSYWYEAHPHVFQAFPYHWLIQPSDDEIFGFFQETRAIALRYSAPIEYPVGRISYHVIYDLPTYDLECLERRSRQNILTGLKNCYVEPVSFDQLAREGWFLEKETAERQHRRPSHDQQTWHLSCMAAAALPGFEAWGAFLENHLVAALIFVKVDDWCELLSQQCSQKALPNRVNHALTFKVTKELVSRAGIRSIFYSVQSLDAPTSVDEFKFRMGYKPVPVRQRVVVHPWIAPFMNKTGLQLISCLRRMTTGFGLLSKTEGMLRFYLEGRQSLVDQTWPECLDWKDTLLAGQNI